MNLPTLESDALPDVELASVLKRAALVLGTEGRKAASACVFGAGTRMMMTADALDRSGKLLVGTRPDVHARDRRAFAEACESVTALAAFLWCERERLESYRAALGRVLEADERRDQDGESSREELKQRGNQ